MTIVNKAPCEGAPPCTDSVPERTQNGLWILVATILASSMAFIDGTVVNVALPALQVALHASVSGIQWVVESYALLLASLLLLGGSMGDMYGRRRMFLFGVGVFVLASTWCGLAQSMTSLIVARGVQGVGAAFLVPGSLALISASFAANKRGRAIGTWSGFTAITASVGPVLGGWLVQHFSWRWVFFINLPLAVVVVFVTLWRVPESRNANEGRHLDWQGAVLATVGLGAITFGLVEGHGGGVVVWACFVGGLVALAAFLMVEAHSPEPMVSLGLFRSRDFSGANLLTFLLYGAINGILFFFPLDLIQVQRYSATQAGAALLPLILLVFVLSRWAGGLVVRYGARMPLTIGPMVVALGFVLFLRPGIGGSYWTTFFPAVVSLGVGMAISVAPLTTAVMESVSVDEAGMASGINNAVSRMAGLLAIAVFGLVLASGFNRALDRSLARMQEVSPAVRENVDRQRSQLAGGQTSDSRIRQAIDDAFLSGYRDVIWLSVGLSLLSAASARMIGSNASTH